MIGITYTVKRTGSLRSRSIPLVLSVCTLAAGNALAEHGDGAEIEGRWETAKNDLVLDIGRCAKGYCGQLVTRDNRCDRTVMTVTVDNSSPLPLELAFAGDFAPFIGIRANYKVRVSVTRAAETKPASMVIIGDEVDPNPLRRTFPYRAVPKCAVQRCGASSAARLSHSRRSLSVFPGGSRTGDQGAKHPAPCGADVAGQRSCVWCSCSSTLDGFGDAIRPDIRSGLRSCGLAVMGAAVGDGLALADLQKLALK